MLITYATPRRAGLMEWAPLGTILRRSGGTDRTSIPPARPVEPCHAAASPAYWTRRRHLRACLGSVVGPAPAAVRAGGPTDIDIADWRWSIRQRASFEAHGDHG